GLSLVRLFILQLRRGVARRVHSRRSMQGIDLQTGIVRHHNFSRNIAAVSLRLLASVSLKRESVLNHGGQGSEIWDAANLNSMPRSRAGKVPQLAGVGSCNQNAPHKLVAPPSRRLSRRRPASAAVNLDFR